MPSFAKNRFVLVALCCVLAASVAAIAARQKDPSDSFSDELREEMISGSVASFSDLADLYAWEWIMFLPLSLPYEDSFLQTLHTPVPLILPQDSRKLAEAFSASFVEGLIPSVKEGITVFPVQLVLDSSRREIEIYNAEEALIQTIPIDDKFLPEEWAKDCFGWGSVRSADRMQLCVDLILEGQIDLYIALQELKAEARQKEASFPVIMKAYEGPAVTNIKFTAVERVTNGVMVTIAYPAGYTNALELFKCEDLVAYWWEACGVSNINPSTNWIEWTDTVATNGGGSKCFYFAGNADLDTDSDLLTDAREQLMYHSSATNSNTDGDSHSDYDEVTTYNTDPSNPDTTKPVILYFFPSNNYQQVWMP